MSIDEQRAYCWPRCPLECSQSLFTKKVASYFYSASHLIQLDANAYAYNEPEYDYIVFDANGTIIAAPMSVFVPNMVNNVVEFSVTYDSSSDISYSEEAKMSGEELLGAIGGHLHLFLGMSLLSFVELAEWIVMLATRLVMSHRGPSQSISKQDD